MSEQDRLILAVENERERQGLSARQVSEKSGWSHNAMYRLMRGQTSLMKFLDICKVLGIRVELFDKTGRRITG